MPYIYEKSKPFGLLLLLFEVVGWFVNKLA